MADATAPGGPTPPPMTPRALTRTLEEFALNAPENFNWAEDVDEYESEDQGVKLGNLGGNGTNWKDDNNGKSTENSEPNGNGWNNWSIDNDDIDMYQTIRRKPAFLSPMPNTQPTSRKRVNRILPTPSSTDSLETIEHKITDMALAIQAGQNIAEATGHPIGAAVQQNHHDPIATAKRNMKPRELELYEAWEALKTGNTPTRSLLQFSLPKIDWTRDLISIPTGKKSLDKFQKRSVAIIVAYALDDVTLCTPEHAHHFTVVHSDYLPLLHAICKVLAAYPQPASEGNKAKGNNPYTEQELAELQVMKAANSVVSQAICEAYKELKGLTFKIERAQKVLKEREGEIRAKVKKAGEVK